MLLLMLRCVRMFLKQEQLLIVQLVLLILIILILQLMVVWMGEIIFIFRMGMCGSLYLIVLRNLVKVWV